MLSQKNVVRILINTGLGAVLIFIWFKLVDIEAIWREITQVSLVSILPFLLFFILSNLFRSIRLKILLSSKDNQSTKKISLKSVYFLNHLSQLLSFTIPIRAGEVAKGVYLSTEYNLPFAKSLVWILMDRFLDFWMILILTFVLLFFVQTQLPSNLAPILLLLIGLMSVGVSMVIFTPKLTKKLINLFKYLLIINFAKKIFQKVTDYLIDSASFLKRGVKDTLLLILVTILALISDGLGWFIIFSAVFPEGVNFLKILLGSFLSSLTFIIPAAPGYVGSAEASGLAVFGYSLGLDKTLSSVVIVINHAITLIMILVLGITSLYILKFNLNLVWKKFKKD